MNIGPAGIDDNWRVLRLLGQGGEGAAFLVEDRTTCKRWVFKSFHNPLPAARLQSLLIYESSVLAGDCAGLPAIKLEREGDWILGVRYPYVTLYRVHRFLLRSIEQVGQALVGSHCHMQHHLISRHGIALWDTDPVNFMLARDGHFHWTDFGTAMEVVSRPPGTSRGGFEFGFATLLLGIHGINFKLIAQYSESYTYDGPCIYFMNAALDDVSNRHQWVRDIVEMVRSRRAAAFLEPEFYQQLGAGLPKRVIGPTAVIAGNALLSRASGLRARLRNSQTMQGEK